MAAKNTIVTRITLEGAQQITGDLKNLGAAGERALKQIRDSAEAANSGGIKLAAIFTRVSQSFKQAGEAAQNLGKKIDAVEKSFGTVAKRVGILTTAVVGAAAGFLAFNIKAGASAEELQNQASAVGLTTGELQKFGFAARVVGLDSDRFTQVMSILTDEMQKTADAADPAATALGKLGISVTDGAGGLRNAGDVLKDVANRIAGLGDGTEKTSAVIDLFGRRIGAKLIPFLNLGATGLQNLGNEGVRLGAVVSDQVLTKLAAFDDSLDILKATAKGTQLSIAAIFAPALTQGANALTALLAQEQGRLEEFAQSIVNTVLPVVHDIINAITGHDADVNAQWVLDIRDQLIQLGAAAKSAFNDIILPALRFIGDAADRAAQLINGIFGTTFTGKELLIAAALLQLAGIFGALASIIGVVVAAFGLLGSEVALVIAAVVLVGTDIILFSKLLARIDWAGIAQGILDSIVGAFRAVGNAIKGAFADALNFVKGLFADLADYISNSWLGQVVGAVARAIAGIRNTKSAADQAASAGADTGKRIGGLAQGGQAGRPGRRGASDTVLAWLDPAEFVMRSQAVASVGANVMQFINETGRLPAFATGGMVASVAGARQGATLSPVIERPDTFGGARNVLNLSIDGKSFEGLLMDDDTAAAIGRFAKGKQMTSGGRKPGWYRGQK